MKDTFALNLPDNLMSNTYDVEVNQYQWANLENEQLPIT
jgi:hypothetical protein